MIKKTGVITIISSIVLSGCTIGGVVIPPPPKFGESKRTEATQSATVVPHSSIVSLDGKLIDITQYMDDPLQYNRKYVDKYKNFRNEFFDSKKREICGKDVFNSSCRSKVDFEYASVLPPRGSKEFVILMYGGLSQKALEDRRRNMVKYSDQLSAMVPSVSEYRSILLRSDVSSEIQVMAGVY